MKRRLSMGSSSGGGIVVVDIIAMRITEYGDHWCECQFWDLQVRHLVMIFGFENDDYMRIQRCGCCINQMYVRIE